MRCPRRMARAHHPCRPTAKRGPTEAGTAAGGSRRDCSSACSSALWWRPCSRFLVLVLFGEGDLEDPGEPRRATPFRVEDNRIVAPDGTRFVVKGVTIPYGTFAGGDAKGLGALNFATVERDLRRLQGPRGQYRQGPGHSETERPDADVEAADRRRESRGDRASSSRSAPRSRASGGRRTSRAQLAREYRDDSYIWLQPMNEPNCPSGPPVPDCFDWVLWQQAAAIHNPGHSRRGDDLPGRGQHAELLGGPVASSTAIRSETTRSSGESTASRTSRSASTPASVWTSDAPGPGARSSGP